MPQRAKAAKIKMPKPQPEVEPCELCGKDMALKRGRFGAFYGCTGYPECKNIRKIDKKSGEAKQVAPPVEFDEECPKDGAKLVIRQGRFGEFTSCSNYPKCDYIKRDTLGIPCTKPGCKGEIVVKKSKRGKAFYGCSEYPKCDVVFWDKPIKDEPCPNCNAPFFWKKQPKKTARFTIAAVAITKNRLTHRAEKQKTLRTRQSKRNFTIKVTEISRQL